jgi:succinylglutamate desuccinylase
MSDSTSNIASNIDSWLSAAECTILHTSPTTAWQVVNLIDELHLQIRLHILEILG